MAPKAATHLLRYLSEQQEEGALPTHKQIVIERFSDEIGDLRVVILSPFGSRVHAPWATAVAARLQAETGLDIDTIWTDDGMTFRLLEADTSPDVHIFFPSAEEVEELVTRQLGETSLFSSHFRENAGRALLLPKKNPAKRTPLWALRRRASNLLEVASRYPNFPIILETYRECLKDVFDLPALERVLKDIAHRRIRIEVVDRSSPSPFAASVLFSYAANFIYEGDAPLAERRAQALSIDQTQLKSLLGAEELRKLLDPEVIESVEQSLQRLDGKYVLKHPDHLHDLLIQIGDLSAEEIKDRSYPDADITSWLQTLQKRRRIIEVRMNQQSRWSAVEDAVRLRDGLGVVIPPGLPEALLESISDPLQALVGRYAQTHGPFTALQCATRFGVSVGQVEHVLQQLERRGRVLSGTYLPRGHGLEWCNAEVLRRLKQISLARLRAEVEPIDQVALGRFLPEWQGLNHRQRGLDGLLNVLENLQGASLPISDLDKSIIPARLERYRPEDLDELCSAGEVIWRGIEPIGPKDGRIALYIADDYPLLSPPTTLAEGELPAQIRTVLTEQGAQFFSGLCQHTQAYPNDVVDALWALVWSGEVTNDTLRPLRTRFLGARRPRPARRARGSISQTRRFRSRIGGPPGTEGRWSLLPSLDQAASETERRAALTQQLLERHGVLTREAAANEIQTGGFTLVYPVLKTMEDAGKIRRGYFIEGLGAVQFAWPGAEDRLRQFRERDPNVSADLKVLAATDPANPYGAALPWPGQQLPRPQRAAGAKVILNDGQLIGFLSRTEETLITFGETGPSEPISQLLINTLIERVQTGDRAFQLITKIDGDSALQHPMAHALKEKGFRATPKGLLFRAQPNQKTHRRES